MDFDHNEHHMKILNVMFTTRMGGLEQVFLDYNDVLISHQHDVISVIHKKSKVKNSIKSELCEISNYSKYDFLTLWRLKKIITKYKPDIIITHGNRAHYMMSKIARETPVIGVSHNYSFDYIIKCDFIITVNKDMISELIKLNYAAQNIYHIPNMIKVPKTLNNQDFKFHNIPIIGVIARLEKTKGIDSFINSLYLLKSQNILFKAKIAGDGPERDNIKSLISKLGLDNEVELMGWTEKKDFYYNVDIVCLPSRVEPFGLVILEAFMYGKPLITSNATGPMEIITDKKDALVFKIEDYEELASNIIAIINDKNLTKKLIKNGSKTLELYEVRNISKRLIGVLTECDTISQIKLEE